MGLGIPRGVLQVCFKAFMALRRIGYSKKSNCPKTKFPDTEIIISVVLRLLSVLSST
jgi:hypothetical protein